MVIIDLLGELFVMDIIDLLGELFVMDIIDLLGEIKSFLTPRDLHRRKQNKAKQTNKINKTKTT